MSCKLSDKCNNVFACNVLRPEVELLGCNFYKPKKPLTNEEYIKSLNTEQLAEFISKIDMPFMDKAPFPCGDLIECNKNCGLYSRCVKDDFPTNKEVWVEWLKQPYTEKE